MLVALAQGCPVWPAMGQSPLRNAAKPEAFGQLMINPAALI